jgi:hypothetical protein
MMVYKGRPSWPPHWVWIDGVVKNEVEGEVGTLENVQLSRVVKNTIYLTISTPDGNRYVGSLNLANEHFADTVFQLLRNHLGRSVQSIAEIDIV